MGGDLNLNMILRLDKVDKTPNHNDNQNFRADVCPFIETNNTVGAWCTVSPYKRCFTWHRGAKEILLDYAQTSEHLLNFIDDVNILPRMQSHHSLIKLSLSGNRHEKGMGFWKSNPSLLNDPVYVDKMIRVTRKTSQNYEVCVWGGGGEERGGRGGERGGGEGREGERGRGERGEGGGGGGKGIIRFKAHHKT